MSEYSRTNFNSAIGTLYDDTLASGATTRANHRTANGHVKDSAAWLEDFNPVTASGTDTYTCSMAATLTSYSNGRFYLIKFTNGNSTASTLNVNSLGAKSIKKNATEALVLGDIPDGAVCLLAYDGTNFQLLTTLSNLNGTLLSISNNSTSKSYTRKIADYSGTTTADGTQELAILSTDETNAIPNNSIIILYSTVAQIKSDGSEAASIFVKSTWRKDNGGTLTQLNDKLIDSDENMTGSIAYYTATAGTALKGGVTRSGSTSGNFRFSIAVDYIVRSY